MLAAVAQCAVQFREGTVVGSEVRGTSSPSLAGSAVIGGFAALSRLVHTFDGITHWQISTGRSRKTHLRVPVALRQRSRLSSF